MKQICATKTIGITPKRVASSAVEGTQPKTYAPGYFCEPVAAWRSMRFESRIADLINPATKRFRTEFELLNNRAKQGMGFDRNPLGLPGSRPYTPRA